MTRRITQNVQRGEPFSLHVGDQQILAYDGETIATALLAADITAFRRDKSGNPRAPYCAMGVCFECRVAVSDDGGQSWRRLRGCATLALPGMMIRLGNTP